MKLYAVAAALAAVCAVSSTSASDSNFRKGPSGDDPNYYIKRQYGIGVSDCDFFSASNLPALNVAGYGYNSVTGKRSDQPVLKTTEYGKMIAVQGYGPLLNSPDPTIESTKQCFRIPDAFAGKDGLGIAFSDNQFQSSFDTITTTSLRELAAAQAAEALHSAAYTNSFKFDFDISAGMSYNSSTASKQQTEKWNTINRLITDETASSEQLDEALVAAGAASFGVKSDFAHMTSEVFAGTTGVSLSQNKQKFLSVSTIAGHYYSASLLNFRLTNRFVHGLLQLEKVFKEYDYLLSPHKKEGGPGRPGVFAAADGREKEKSGSPPPVDDDLLEVIKNFFDKFGDRYYKRIKVGGKFEITRSAEFETTSANFAKTKEEINTCLTAIMANAYLNAEGEVHYDREYSDASYDWENNEYDDDYDYGHDHGHGKGKGGHGGKKYPGSLRSGRTLAESDGIIREDDDGPKGYKHGHDYPDVYYEDEEFYGDDSADQREKETSRKKVFAFDLKASVSTSDDFSHYHQCSSGLKNSASFADSLSNYMASCKSFCKGGVDACPPCDASPASSSAAFSKWIDALREAPTIVNPVYGRMDKLLERYAGEHRFTKYFHDYHRFVMAFKRAICIYYSHHDVCSSSSYYSLDPSCDIEQNDFDYYDEESTRYAKKEAHESLSHNKEKQKDLKNAAETKVNNVGNEIDSFLTKPPVDDYKKGGNPPQMVPPQPQAPAVLSADDRNDDFSADNDDSPVLLERSVKRDARRRRRSRKSFSFEE